MSGGPSTLAALRAILAKDLRVELRTLQALPAMALFAVTTFVIFHFALDRSSLDGSLAAGVLWTTILFASILGINRLFVAERDEGGFDAIMLAPIDRSALLGAKAASMLIYLVALELVAVPAFALFFLDDAGGLAELAAVALVTDVGIAVAGTLISAMAVHSRARDLIVPLVLLPFLIPLITAAAAASKPLLELGGPHHDRFFTWLGVVGLYDLIFVLLAWAVFDFLVED